MKELPTTLNADDIFVLGRAAERAGFKTLQEFVAYLLVQKARAFAAATPPAA